MTDTTKPILSVPFVDLKAQYQSIAGQIDAALASVVQSGAFILGPELAAFEQEFAAYCGTRFAIGVDCGTSALEMALRAHGIGPGDEVITTANTFFATAAAVTYTGARPVLVDIEPLTYNMDVVAAEQAITPRTKGIIPVHLYGQPADMDPILEIARRRGLIVIEDACQAHGARYKDRRVGALGNAAAFSFYPAKNLGCYGDGGMVVTDDEQLADRIRLLHNEGQRQKYHHEIVGYNCLLDSIQAAVLRVKLNYLDEWNAARRRHAARYTQLLAGSHAVTPHVADYAEHVFHLYVVRVTQRDELRAWLAGQGIGTGIHYPIPIHLQPAYRHLGYAPGTFPVTEQYAGQILSLPMFAELADEQIDRVAALIRSFYD